MKANRKLYLIILILCIGLVVLVIKISTNTSLSVSDIWNNKEKFQNKKISLIGQVAFIIKCPAYEGCCKPGECVSEVSISDEDSGSILIYENHKLISCRDKDQCGDWINGKTYSIEGVFIKPEHGSWYVNVINKKRLN